MFLRNDGEGMSLISIYNKNKKRQWQTKVAPWWKVMAITLTGQPRWGVGGGMRYDYLCDAMKRIRKGSKEAAIAEFNKKYDKLYQIKDSKTLKNI